jgi:hypothetical protein
MRDASEEDLKSNAWQCVPWARVTGTLIVGHVRIVSSVPSPAFFRTPRPAVHSSRRPMLRIRRHQGVLGPACREAIN